MVITIPWNIIKDDAEMNGRNVNWNKPIAS